MARFLTSKEGEEWLEFASQFSFSSSSHLADVENLRRHLSPSKSAAIMEQVKLRTKAIRRFPNASRMLFTNAGLQQATHPVVAAHRAQRFSGWNLVGDIGCGIGSDSVALSRVVKSVVAVDRDPIRICFARHNARVETSRENAHFVWADAEKPPFRVDGSAVFCDPSRRTAAGRRIHRTDRYEPPLPELYRRYGAAEGLAVKVAPGVSFQQIAWADEIEVTSIAGRVKEAVLWTGALATPGIRRRATLLPSGESVTDGCPGSECPVQKPGRYLHEPDGAVIRAGLIRQVCHALQLWQLDHRIAYLSSDTLRSSTFVKSFEVEEQMPFNLKRLRKRLRELRVGVLEIKKRGINLDPDTFRHRLRLDGPETRTLIVTRIGDKPIAFLCHRTHTGSHSRLPVGGDVE